VLEAQMQPARIEKMVAAARWRNLGVALVLNVSLIAAGLAYIRYTRRSRMLAQSQMRFAANVSHELRTPLTVIRGAGHNLLCGVVADREKQQEYAKLIVQHAEDLSEMVEQILDLGKARNIRSAKALEEVDVGQVVTAAVAATQEETKGNKLEVQIAPALFTVSGDAGSLQRAFQNLIVNAAKHGGKGGWIGVTGVTDEDTEPNLVEIQVADRGEGIAPEDLAEIFEPFYRGTAAEAEQIRGSGLGLSLVKEIIEAHGGSVSVKSQQGQSTTFTVRLPSARGKRSE
jgi:two-component system phosphate regulon sensor histidine kinase PhoR